MICFFLLLIFLPRSFLHFFLLLLKLYHELNLRKIQTLQKIKKYFTKCFTGGKLQSVRKVNTTHSQTGRKIK
nr:MAG TPA: hypothetical protein [Caudoviricetes sp.]